MNMNTSDLIPAGAFALLPRWAGLDADTVEELRDEMGDLDPEGGISCRKIRIPSGGGLAYEIQGEDDAAPEYRKEIDAVLVFTHRANGYWRGSYGTEDGTRTPVCSSMDGKTGYNNETGETLPCDTCPFNAFGSAAGNGGQGRGKACKNMRRLYLMMNGDPNLYLLTVPPTSIRDVNRQLNRILAGGTPYTGTVVRLTLERAANSAGTAYSRVVIRRAGTLGPEAAAAAKSLRRELREQYQSVAITLDDYTPAPRPAPAPSPIVYGGAAGTAGAAGYDGTAGTGATGSAAAPDLYGAQGDTVTAATASQGDDARMWTAGSMEELFEDADLPF